MSKTTEFLTELFGYTEGCVWLQALGSKPGQCAAGATAQTVDGFVEAYDVPGNGVYVCVSTMAHREKRGKDNVADIIGLWVDVDLKDVIDTPDDVTRKILAARKPPSILNNSGNGRHGWWLFKEPLEGAPENQARVEMALKQLADLFGGDHAVTHCAALMRLPGSHNTKRGAWIECETIARNGARYELDDLEEWLSETSPVILRKERPAQFQETNPFLAIAATLGFKPPIDVEKRLAGMQFMGGGEAAVHATQLAVSASMLRQGANTETVVGTILDATRAAAGDYGKHWNWRREENAIRKMCTDWLRKHPAENVVRIEPARGAVQGNAINESVGAGGNVVALAPKRAMKAAQAANTVHHIVLGEAVLGVMRARGEDLLVTGGEVWFYADGLWSQPKGEKSCLDVEIETAARALEFPSTIKLINEARSWLLRHPDLVRREIKWDNHGKIPTRSGLVDPLTLELTPARPDHFCSWRLECDYDPAATCPWWERLLADIFGDREEANAKAHVNVIQDVLGAALIDSKPRALSKALVLQGVQNCGKSGVLEVMSGLFGSATISTSLDDLDNSHGLMQFTRRLPWVLHEAFKPNKWHFSSAVKAIITHEPVMINIKNGPMISMVVRGPLFWATNYPPQFKEATKAIVNRLIVVHCRREFAEGELIGAAKEASARGFDKPSELILATELSGVLNWAIAGLRRAKERGVIELTDDIKEAANEIRRDSNLVAGFLEECVEYQSTRRVSVPDFCAAFTVWWLQNKGEDRRTPSNEQIGRAMVAMADQRIGIDAKDLRDRLCRYYVGIVLNNAGQAYWKRAVESNQFQGKTTNTTPPDSPEKVNELIPEKWLDKPAVTAMKKAQNAVLSRAVTEALTVTDGTENDS